MCCLYYLTRPREELQKLFASVNFPHLWSSPAFSSEAPAVAKAMARQDGEAGRICGEKAQSPRFYFPE